MGEIIIYKLLRGVQSARATQDEAKKIIIILVERRKGKRKGSDADMVKRRVKTQTRD